MIFFPAIDLKDGQCVRLYQGDMERVTVFGDDPAGQFLLGSTEEMKEHIGKFIKLGFSHFIPVVTAPYDYDALQRFAEEVIPTFRQ